MKQRLIPFAILLFLFVCFAFRLIEKKYTAEKFDVDAYKAKRQVICGTDWSAVTGWLENSDIPPMPGTGKHSWKISTKSDSAQFYFNQGMNMYYGFHILEAMASFHKAKRMDPECAMIWWALALGYGPNINDLGYSASPEALEATQIAQQYSKNSTAQEKELIAAMQVRYSPDSTISRKELNERYTAKMAAAYKKYPASYDIATLYADAMMLEHPWELWNTDGTPKSWTPLIQQVLEGILKKAPDHPGANHYYIHVMEPSPYFDKALPSADRLGKLTPGLAHLVHMPSHIYLRSGNYNTGVDVNINAEKSFETYKALFPTAADNNFLYQWHARHMQLNCAMMAGEKTGSEKNAMELQQMIDTSMLSLDAPLGSYIQYIYYSNILVHIRFGNWDKLLALPEPSGTHTYARILFHFGRGMAFAGTNSAAQAAEELTRLKELMKDDNLKLPLSPFSPAIDGAVIAEKILAGTIALNQGRMEEAITDLKHASDVEEQMVYNEPRDWLLNPKPYLGNALLRAKKWADAERVFSADLKNNRENGWSLYGLYMVAKAKGATAAEKDYMMRFKKAFAKTDIQITAPVY